MIAKLTTATAAVALCLPLMACQRNSTDNASVTTTTAAGQSSAAAAADVEERDNALVRAVYAVPAGAAVDVYADDQRVFDGLTYQTVTPYREVPGERHSFQVRPSGMAQAEPIATNSEGLDDGGHYTVFAVPGDDASAMLRVVKDDHSLPEAGKARLRVVHAAKDAGEIDIFASGRDDALVDGVNFQTVSSYDDIDPVTGTVTVRREGERAALFTLRDVHFDVGKTYTMVVVGGLTSNPKFDAFVIEDVVSSATALAMRP
jgi:hypothetical protein